MKWYKYWVKISNDSLSCNESFFLAILFLLFLLFTKWILLEHLPQFSELWNICEKGLIAKIGVLTGSLGPLMELTELRNHDRWTYLKIAQCLFWAIEHKKATSEVVKYSGCINWLNSQKRFPDFPGLQKGSSSQFILLSIIERLTNSAVGKCPIRVEIGYFFQQCSGPKKATESIVILTCRQVDTALGELEIQLQRWR